MKLKYFLLLFCLAATFTASAQRPPIQAGEKESFDSFGEPGGRFSIQEYAPSARRSSGTIVFPNAKVNKLSGLEVTVRVENGVEMERQTKITDKKLHKKLYKVLLEEYGGPKELIGVNEVYIYRWKDQPVTAELTSTMEYRWNHEEKKGVFKVMLNEDMK